MIGEQFELRKCSNYKFSNEIKKYYFEVKNQHLT